jgi:hypothetical protein
MKTHDAIVLISLVNSGWSFSALLVVLAFLHFTRSR